MAGRAAWARRHTGDTKHVESTGGVTVNAAVVGETGVEVRNVPKPVPAPNEVLIRVRASSLNRADLLVALGHQHGSTGGVGARLGLECAGEVEAIGGAVEGIKVGDRVMAS